MGTRLFLKVIILLTDAGFEQVDALVTSQSTWFWLLERPVLNEEVFVSNVLTALTTLGIFRSPRLDPLPEIESALRVSE